MAVKRKPIGDPGLNQDAINTNRTTEHLTELQGRDGSIRYRQMSRGDSQVGMILRVHKNPIRSAGWGINTPDDAREEEKKAIELLNDWLFDCGDMSFDTMLGQILSFMEYGFSLFEMYWKPYTYDGNVYLVPVLEQRLQTSIEDIFPDKRIVRQVTIEKGLVEIPFEDLVFFVLNQQGQDMRGEALIRNAYPLWKRKNVYEELMGIGIQRTTSGIPWMKVPKGINPDSADYLAVEELLKNIVFHEDAYMIFQDGYEFGVTESKFNAEQVQKAIDSLDTRMALSVLAQFVLLGQGGKGGAYALSRDQSDFFLDGLQYILDLIQMTFHSQVIAPFLRINFGDSIDSKRIQLKGFNLNKKAGEELATVLNTLKQSGFIVPTVDDEVQLRQLLDMPDLTEDEIKKRRERKDDPPEPPEPSDPNKPPEVPPKMTGDDMDDKKMAVKLSEAHARKVKSRAETVDKLTIEVVDFMKANLLLIKDKLMADIETTLKRGVIEIQGLKAIDIPYSRYTKGLEIKLSSIAVDAWNEAKSSARKNIKFAEPKDIRNKELRQFILNQSDSVAEQQVANLKNRAILTASNGPLKGYSISQTLSNVERAISEYIDSNGVVVSGSLVVVGTENFGEMQFYKEIKDQLWGYRFVNVDPVSEICQWYNGKTFSVDSPELSEATAPLHPNCKSYMEPIYRTEENPGKLDNDIAPPSIRKQKSIF